MACVIYLLYSTVRAKLGSLDTNASLHCLPPLSTVGEKRLGAGGGVEKAKRLARRQVEAEGLGVQNQLQVMGVPSGHLHTTTRFWFEGDVQP